MGVVVELPGVGTVFVLIAAMNGEVPRLLRIQMLICFLHTFVGFLQ